MRFARIFAVFFTIGYVTLVKAQICGEGRERYNNKCYQAFPNRRTFSEAKADCASRGEQLVYIDSIDTNEWIAANFMQEVQYERIWIGAEEKHDDWTWSFDGSAIDLQGCYQDNPDDSLLQGHIKTDPNLVPETCRQECARLNYRYYGVRFDSSAQNVVCRCDNDFTPPEALSITECDRACPSDSTLNCGDTNRMLVYRTDGTEPLTWVSNQPNNFDGYQSCLALIVSSGVHKVGDETCQNTDSAKEFARICQYPRTFSSCRDIWIAGQCISIHKDNVNNWYHARSRCAENGGDLVKIVSNTFYDELINRAELRGSSMEFWIGGSNRRFEYPNGDDMKYYNWAHYEPSNRAHGCVSMYKNTGGGRNRWDDVSCDATYPYVCQTSVPTTTTSTTTSTSTTTTTTTTTKPPTTPTTTTTRTTNGPASTSRNTPSTVSQSVPTTTTTTTTSTTTTTTTPRPVVSSRTPAPPVGTPSTARRTFFPPASTTTTRGSGNPTQAPSVLPPGVSSQVPGVTTTNEATTRNPNAVSGGESGMLDDLPIGVIVAIVIAGLAVLLATIRLIVYCCQRRSRD